MSETAATGRDVGVVQSVDRAITILETMARMGEAGVSEVARELGVHKSTAFRLLATLAARGLVEQGDDRGKYRIGLGLVRLAGTSAARTDVVQAAHAVGKQLAIDTGETINVAVLRDDSALYLDQIAGAAGLQPHNWVGLRIPLHATSDGKVLLAFLAPHDVDQLVPRLEAHTERTVTRRSALHRELGETRRRGYAVTVDELEEGLSAVAAPIRDRHGDVVASLSISGSTYRMTAESVAEMVEPLIRAAHEASFEMGWPGQGTADTAGSASARPAWTRDRGRRRVTTSRMPRPGASRATIASLPPEVGHGTARVRERRGDRRGDRGQQPRPPPRQARVA